MAHLSRLQGKHRLRYRISFPDGGWADRSRKYRTRQIARAMWPEAARLEEKTRRHIYSHAEIEKWRLEGFLNAQDAKHLGHSAELKTLAMAAEEYQHSWDLGAKEAEAREARLRKTLEILGNPPLRTLSYADGLRLQNELKVRGYKVATVQKFTQDLKRMLNLQVANRSIEFNPFASLRGGRIPQAEKIKHVTLTDQQVAEVIETSLQSPLLGGWLSILLLLAFGCGLRRGEILNARWEGIDWEERSLTVTGKGGKFRKVGLGHRLFYQLLRRQPKDPTAYNQPILPPYVPWSLSRAFRQHLQSCGIRMRLHDARHTYTSLIQAHGAKPIDAMARTGHADMRMLSHYSHGKFDRIWEDSFSFMQVPETKGANG
jgi:integrase